MIKTQFTLYLKNEPGALAAVAKKLGQAKVNIEGISAASSADVGLVQVIVSHPAATSRALKQANIAFTTQKVAVLTLQHQPGELARVAERLARRRLNISYMYGTACQGECDFSLVVSASNLKDLEDVWQEEGGRKGDR